MPATTSRSSCKPVQITQPPARGKKNLAPGGVSVHANRQAVPEKGPKTGGMCVYTYTYRYGYMCVCVCVCVCMYLYTYIHLYICIYTYICICICIYIGVTSESGRGLGLKKGGIAKAAPEKLKKVWNLCVYAYTYTYTYIGHEAEDCQKRPSTVSKET